MKKLIIITGAIIVVAGATVIFRLQHNEKVAVIYPQNAQPLEEFSAREIQRYFYLSTGRMAELISSDELPSGFDQYFLTGIKGEKLFRNEPVAGDITDRSVNLKDEEFFIKTVKHAHARYHIIEGGDGRGTLYGAYRLLEHTGVKFNIDGDVLPDNKFDARLLEVNEYGKPRFLKRGLQPFHDFNVGPDWWNLNDYNSVITQMAKMRLNFIGFHTYPSWNSSAGPEANVWIGLPEDVDDQGNVKSGYEAGVVTTLRGWEVKPFATGKYASGAGLLFENDDYGPDFLLDYPDWPKNNTDAVRMFNLYGDFQKKVFENAKKLGISPCVGTELPLGIPPMLASDLKSKGMDPADPLVIKELYKGTFLRLMRKMPLDYFWLWLPEIWLWSEPGCKGWEITTERNVEREIKLIESAAKELDVPFGLATSGWRLGTMKDPMWTARNTPGTWAISSINTSTGRDPVEKYYGDIKDHPKWAIGWAEDDNAAQAHCCTAWDVQLWVGRMFANSYDASRYGCEGMMAIHWRTSSIAPNIDALSQSGWEFAPSENNNIGVSADADDMNLFWENWGREMFGGDTGAKAGQIIRKLDGSHIKINDLIYAGCRTTDQQIAGQFTAVDELESIRKTITGKGNLERFDYWLNYLKASKLRVRTWVLSARLDSVMTKAGSLPGGDDRLKLVKETALPIRLSLARSWESMIAAYLDCARSTGEMGTITSIESGNRNRILHRHDSTMMTILGNQLPDEASVSTLYTGSSRIFMTSVCTQANKGEPLELRPFVLSAVPCTKVTLYWRPLASGTFNKVIAYHRGRQAYRVSLPESVEGCIEYYLEASMENGEKIFYPVTAPSLNQTTIFW